MKESFLVSVGLFLIVICCTLTAAGNSFILFGLQGSTLAILAAIGAVASFGYFFFGK
jgi:hypothetical protein